MHITRLRLTGFKAHDELDISPASGLTIVRGPNEAGKSSIQQALELVLFRKADANREDVRRAWSWDSETPPEVEIEFEADDVSGMLRKRFGAGRSEGELTLDGQVVGDYQLIQDQLAELTGVPNESFYRATASVSHADLGAVAGAESAIGDRLQKAVSGADRGTAKARKKLETAVHRYRTEGHKNPGLLKVNRAQIADLERDVSEGEAALAQLESDRARLVESDARCQELETELTRLQADHAEAERAEKLAKRRDETRDDYDRLRRAAVLMEEADTLRRSTPTSLPLAQVRTAVSRLEALEFESSELEAEIATAVEAAAIDDDDQPVPPRPMAWLAAGALLVLAGWAAMFLLRDAGLAGVAIVAAIGVAVIVVLAQAFRLAARRRRYGLAMQMADHAVAEHEVRSRAQQEQLRRDEREMTSLLETLDVPDRDAAAALLASLEKQTEQLAKIEGELRGLGVDEQNLRRLEEARDQAANEVEMARHALAAMGELAEDPAAARMAALRQIAQATPDRDAARSKADQARGRIDANVIDAELVASLSERLIAARERGAELERRAAVYEGTLEALEAAERATLKTAARYLEERMGPAIATITDGRYDEIQVDEKSLAFKVRAPETGELVDVDRLSQGTADQLFLAARLGLVRLVTLERRPPLILDDPFVTFDAARGERALRLVKQLSHEQGFQVLYLTCSDRFDTLADELVVLPGPSAERVSNEPAAARPAADAGPGPTLTFAPDPRPNPDPVAPRRDVKEPARPVLFDELDEPDEPEPKEADGPDVSTSLRKAVAGEADNEDGAPA